MPNLSVVNKASAAAPVKNSSSNASDTQPAELFGSLLAQQVQEQSPNAADTSSTSVTDSKKIAVDKKPISAKPGEEKTSTPSILANDPAANLLAMLPPTPPVRDSKLTTGSDNFSASKTLLAQSLGAALPDKNPAKTSVHQRAELSASPATSVAQNISPAVVDTKKLSVALSNSETVSSASNVGNKVQILERKDAAVLAPVNMPIPSTTLAASRTEISIQTINTPLNSPNWNQEFTQKISWMSSNNQREQIAELHLNPPDLGPLNVVLKISDNQATASFTSAHSEVRDAIANAMPALREVLANNGITLGNTSISDQTPRGNNAAAFGGQQSQQNNRQWTNSGDDLSEQKISASSPRITLTRHDGMVDTFV